MNHIEVPDASELDSGIIKCRKCGARIVAEEGLTVQTCPSCSTQIYVPLKISSYIIYKPLGGGGEGFVYKARRLGSKEKFAIKLIPPSKKNRGDYSQKLLKEASIAKALSPHVHLVEFIESGFYNNEPYLVYKFVDGERLDHLIERKRKLSEKQTLNIVKQIIEAEEYILSKGILYRDLKPENILVEKTGNIRLCDFGLSQPIYEASTPSLFPEDEFEGSPYYLPPERILGKPEGEFSEIYSLGMIAFHMLKGETYFSATEINELISKHIEPQNQRDLSLELPYISSDFLQMIRKMISIEPQYRYQNFNSLKKDLQELEEKINLKPTFVLKSKKQQYKAG